MRGSMTMILFGLLLLLGGVLAVVNPLSASLAVTTLVGVFLLVGGAVQLWVAFTESALPHRIWTGISALLALVVGISLLANPLQALISLTLLIGILFLIGGVIRLFMAFSRRDSMVFWPFLLSGAASIIIGLMLVANLLAAATSLLGLLLGIQLLAEGIALITLGFVARRQP